VSRKAATILLIITLQSLPPQVKARCNGQQAFDYQTSINYKAHIEQGMLSAGQWDKALELGRSYLEVPYFAGFLETDLIRGWKLVDLAGERPPDAVIAAVSGNGQSGHVFFADYRHIKKKDLLQERIRKADLKFYNNMLRAETVTINSPSQALDVSLVFLKAATHRARGFFIQVINNPLDIPKPSDEKRRFSGIVREETDESSAREFRTTIERLSSIVAPPRYSERKGKYELSFFTWDPVFGDVEHWCVTVSNSGISSFSRKLISNRV
jgi:hypothetical protein